MGKVIVEPTILYFAYGSNMDQKQMKKRCPGSKLYMCYKLKGYALDFTHNSISWGGGVADVIKSSGSNVWGIIYKVTPQDLENLDGYEGYSGKGSHNVYDRKVFRPTLEGKQVKVYLYIVQAKRRKTITPSKRYMQGLIKGAIAAHLPLEYISTLKQIPTVT
jgi:gamma-glutamylcyclotransferase (GGCT)/AIG2-like uncharacterized protein YtfP